MELIEGSSGTGWGQTYGWSRARFESLDEHYAALKRVRPTLGWRSRQLCTGQLAGSVITTRTARRAVTCTAASGSVEMVGPVSTGHLVLTMSLVCPTPGLQWMHAVGAGMVAVVQPGTPVDAVNRHDVSFAVIDLSHEKAEGEAAREGLAIPAGILTRDGIAPGRIDPARVARIARMVDAAHHRDDSEMPPGLSLASKIVATAIGHLAAAGQIERPLPEASYLRIVARARTFIEAHLDHPISIDVLAHAAITSRRTLHRAFLEVLGETPLGYVLKLRLNRIRDELATPAEAARTVTSVSHQ